jgi:hypothetical protein
VRRSTEEKQALLSAWTSSGLSAQAFAQREGVRAGCLWRWKREMKAAPSRSALKARAAITFAPVHITKAPVSAQGAERILAEVVIERDVRVRVPVGADVERVTALVRALAQGVSC